MTQKNCFLYHTASGYSENIFCYLCFISFLNPNKSQTNKFKESDLPFIIQVIARTCCKIGLKSSHYCKAGLCFCEKEPILPLQFPLLKTQCSLVDVTCLQMFCFRPYRSPYHVFLHLFMRTVDEIIITTCLFEFGPTIFNKISLIEVLLSETAPVSPPSTDWLWSNATHIYIQLSGWDDSGCDVTRWEVDYRLLGSSLWQRAENKAVG